MKGDLMNKLIQRVLFGTLMFMVALDTYGAIVKSCVLSI